MGKPKKQRKSFDYQRDRRRSWKKSKKLPSIHCKQIKEAWDAKKSICNNLHDMGLSADPNSTFRIPGAKELLLRKETLDQQRAKGKKQKKLHVAEELEAEAALPQEQRLKLSEPDAQFCAAMIAKYGDNFKAMARDATNYYQETPKQIARKIRIYMKTSQKQSSILP
ncbi:nucleolar protein 16-like [Pomacea canaliculata]|uniref:nucleolar protein 16-like n=1 Tax=Pomacea canaliculata TaxID=400727 RepID=UPI000D725C11|nr:nucleolar protein 16-like [Pomacea canaliculata]